MAHDDAILAQLGVTAELARKMGVFGNFAISFSVVCNLAGGMSLFGYGLDHGRPAVMLAVWIVIGFMALLVGMSLADVVSAYPTSGGPYFVADKLGEPRWGWTTGPLTLLGAIAGIDYGAAAFTGTFTQMHWRVMPADTTTILIFGSILSPLYVCLIGALLAGSTFCGYDAGSHVSEETTQPRISAPKGIVRAIAVSWIAGFILPAGMPASIQRYDATQNSATGVPPAQIFLDVLGAAGAKALLLIVIAAMLFCGNAEVAAASRMIYAFSRSRAPAALADLAACQQSHLDAYRSCVAVGLCAVRPCTARPMVSSRPRRHHRDQRGRRDPRPWHCGLPRPVGADREPGPWSLGRWRRVVGCIAVAYVVIITVIFCLPQSAPITPEFFNYAGVTLAIALVPAWLTWITRGRREHQLTTHASTAQQGGLEEDV